MKLALVGAEEHTRDLAPWDDPDYEIWVLNEYATTSWCKRFDAILQLHPKSSYQRTGNDKDPEHWSWLQQKRGKPIYLQEVDPLVPDSVKYPLAEINKEFLSTLTWEGEHIKNYSASICYAVALGLYLHYESIDVYGVELVHDLHYSKQQPNFAFWVGVATGRKVPVNLHCSRGTFDQPLYGYEVYMDHTDKLGSYVAGMLEQLEATKRQLAMLEGAIQFAKQLQEEAKKEKEQKLSLEKDANDEKSSQEDSDNSAV